MSSLGLHVLWEVSSVRYPSPPRSHLRTEVAPVRLTGRPHRALDRCPLLELPLMGREAASRPRTPGFTATERVLSGTLESTESCCKSRWGHGSAHLRLLRNLELVLRLRRRHHLLRLRTSGIPGLSRVLFGDGVARCILEFWEAKGPQQQRVWLRSPFPTGHGAGDLQRFSCTRKELSLASVGERQTLEADAKVTDPPVVGTCATEIIASRVFEQREDDLVTVGSVRGTL